MVLITIDKEYQFPTQLNEITLRQFISISEKINNKDYENVVFDLIKISEDVFFNINIEGRFKIIQFHLRIIKKTKNHRMVFQNHSNHESLEFQ